MENPAVTEPEGNVRCLIASIRNQIAPLEVVLVDDRPGLFLLICITRHKPPEPAVRHVHEPGAVDPALGHPAPEISGTEVPARLLDHVAVEACDGVLADPAGIVVDGADPCPAVATLLDVHRLTFPDTCDTP